MTQINEKTFIQELLQAFPEFKEIHEKEKEYHDIGVNIIFGDFRRFAEEAIEQNSQELCARIIDFIIRCHAESKDEVNNAILVSFFENMNEEPLQYFLANLPKDFAEEVKDFLKAFDEATAKGSALKNNENSHN